MGCDWLYFVSTLDRKSLWQMTKVATEFSHCVLVQCLLGYWRIEVLTSKLGLGAKGVESWLFCLFCCMAMRDVCLVLGVAIWEGRLRKACNC